MLFIHYVLNNFNLYVKYIVLYVLLLFSVNNIYSNNNTDKDYYLSETNQENLLYNRISNIKKEINQLNKELAKNNNKIQQ
ncbi:MAG TPA: hypothetical protein PK222_09225, partial [Bacteroidales bacterium]|nr:hypothetical protein [Bacteroidales bacterium]